MSSLSSQITINLTYVERDRSCVQKNTFLLSISSVQPQELVTCKLGKFIITARKRSLRRLCFHRCLWGCLPHCMLGYTPPRTRGRHPPPPGLVADTPRADTTLSRHLPGQTPHWVDTPLQSACWDTANKRAVRIPLECILVYILHGLHAISSPEFVTLV